MTPIQKVRDCKGCKTLSVFILNARKPRESHCGRCGHKEILDGDKVQVIR